MKLFRKGGDSKDVAKDTLESTVVLDFLTQETVHFLIVSGRVFLLFAVRS